MADSPIDTLKTLFQSESQRIYATLTRILGDFDLAEDALQEAFLVAADKWPKCGIPANPVAWLVSTARYKAIDELRKQEKRRSAARELAVALVGQDEDEKNGTDAEDDRLALVFLCCHPLLPFEAQIALTLREVCGLTTESIARACLAKPSAIAQRIVRAKALIRKLRIPFKFPLEEDIEPRFNAVLRVIYLVFNEGYTASFGTDLTRPDLSSEAIRIGRILVRKLLKPESYGLLALMLLQESRRSERLDDSGELLVLEKQNRERWNQTLIEEGLSLLEQAEDGNASGPYTLQAAIAAEHARAKQPEHTDWECILSLYDRLVVIEPSPVVDLNRVIALGMARGPEAGLWEVDALLQTASIQSFHYAHATKAEFLSRLNRYREAASSYREALTLSSNEKERAFLRRRIDEMKAFLDQNSIHSPLR